MYKGQSRISFDSMFTLSNVANTRGHTVNITKNRWCQDSRRHFFSEWLIDSWNRLPQHIIDSASLDAFKSGLDRLRSTSVAFSRTSDPLSHASHIYSGLWNQVRPHLGCTWYVYLLVSIPIPAAAPQGWQIKIMAAGVFSLTGQPAYPVAHGPYLYWTSDFLSLRRLWISADRKDSITVAYTKHQPRDVKIVCFW